MASSERAGAVQGTWEGGEKDGHPQDAWGSADSQGCSLQPPPLRFQTFQYGGLSFEVFFFLAILCGLQDLSSLTRYQTQAPCSGNAES